MPARKWPARTQKGADCLKCKAKGEGVFCHLHQDGEEEKRAPKQPSARCPQQPPEDDGAQYQQQRREKGPAGKKKVVVEAPKPKPKPCTQVAVAAGRRWPALTTKDEDCLKCMDQGKGNFCYIHEDEQEEAAEAPKPKAKPKATKQATAASRRWPALTTKDKDCRLCIDEGEGNFCRHHKDAGEEQEEEGVPAAKANPKPEPSKQATAAGGRRWPALTIKGADCLKCIDEGKGNFCYIHDEESKTTSAAKPKAAGGAGGAGGPAATAAVRTDGVRALCLGASQHPEDYATPFPAIRNPDQADAEAPRDRASPGALPDIERDVHLFRSFIESHFRGEAQHFVGKDGSTYMTNGRFISLVKKFLFEPTPTGGGRGKPPQYFALYVLYFAGHGDGADGHFCVEKNETVALDDILKAWGDSAPFKAGGSKLLIVADSCHSGAMAEYLHAICTRGGARTREAKVARTVAVQAACGAREYAVGGVFTQRYVKEVAKDRIVLDRNRLFLTTHFPAHVQRPNYYCPWGEVELSTGPRGKTVPLYKA